MANELPKGWIRSCIGEVCAEINSGSGFPKQHQGKSTGDYPFAKVGDISRHFRSGLKTIESADNYISEKIRIQIKGKAFPKGSIVFPKIGEALKGNYRVITDCEMLFDNNVMGVTPHTKFIDKKYIFYYLTTQDFGKFSVATAVPSIRRGDIEAIEVLLPPLNEQKRIVAKIEELFSELENGIAALKTAREQLKVYRQAVLKHAFEGKLTEQWRKDNADKLESPEQLLARIQQERETRYQQQLEDWKAAVKTWEANGKEGKKPGKPRENKYDIELGKEEEKDLPKLPNSWMWVALNELISGLPRAMQSGPFGSNLKHSEFSSVGKLVIGIDNVKDGYFTIGSGNRISDAKFAELEKYEARPGDLLVTVMASLGRTCVVPRDIEQAIITKHVYRISMEQHLLYPEFYNYLLQSHTVSRLRMFENAQGQTRLGLNSTILKELPVPLCQLEEQKLIVDYIEEKLNSITNFDNEIDNALKRAETLRQSILKKAFSGQLVPQDPNDEPASELLARIQAEKAASGAKSSKTSAKRGCSV